MSIFQAKEWWSTTVGDGEEFDHNSICIANIDNDESRDDKIIVGSFEGKLRIYKPNRKKNNKYHPEDLIIEKNMSGPILQVSAGKFCKSVPGICLAILTNRALSLHQVESTNSFSKITDLTVHKLERNAFNFIHGYFLNEKKRTEQICAQSVDGALYFIDDESILFKIQLADYLVPGPMIYSSEVDYLIIANSNMELEAYSYQSMKAFTNNDLDQ
jgi:Bardet-Biedl syndrome 9 protein